jgi:hypothetical protein
MSFNSNGNIDGIPQLSDTGAGLRTKEIVVQNSLCVIFILFLHKKIK